MRPTRGVTSLRSLLHAHGRGIKSRRPDYGSRLGAVLVVARLPQRRYSHAMRPLRYSINVTLDGCCDHRAMSADEDLHRHAVENLNQADALLFGRVTYEMMEAGSGVVAMRYEPRR